jgi:predicted transcriptional regulator
MWPFIILRRRREARIEQILDLLEVNTEMMASDIGKAIGLSSRSLGLILKHMEKHNGITGEYVSTDDSMHWIHRRKYQIGWIKDAELYPENRKR